MAKGKAKRESESNDPYGGTITRNLYKATI
jgi:hypothetical protein